MNAEVCGHDRAVLTMALDAHVMRDAGKRVEVHTSIGAAARAWDNAYGDLRDPAKLAPIIAELLRERGVPDLSDAEFAPTVEVRARVFGEHIMIARRCKGHHKIGGPHCSMPQARAIALRLLDAPLDTDIERMIVEVTT